MSDALWTSQVVNVGRDAGEMLEAGVLILFADPCPDALAEVSVVHSGAKAPTGPIEVGDQFRIGDQGYTVDEVGQRVQTNLHELGHVVIYVNQPEQELLPGAIKATGPALSRPPIGSVLGFYLA